MTSGLRTGCQVLWIMDVWRSEYMNILFLVLQGNQRVIWRFHVYPGIEAGLENLKGLSSQAG